MQAMREQCSLTKDDPVWLVDDATFEKMGALMSENDGRLLGLYDELSAFLTQINVYSGRGLSNLPSFSNSSMGIHGKETQVRIL